MTLVITTIGGQCPMQAEGKIGDKRFYFRARGEHWSLSVGEDDGDPEWHLRVRWSHDQFGAGWMTEVQARAIIERCATAYAATMLNDATEF